VWGINLIGWRIKPYAGRPQWGSAQSRHFDIFGGVWKDVKGAIGGGTPFGGSGAIAHAVNSVTDQASGEQTNKGTSEDSQITRGIGWVLFNGEPNAKANGFVTISGARPGVDGTYTMTEVEHNYTRGVGYTTRANVRNPAGTGGGMEWVQDGDTEEEKEKRQKAYESGQATNDPNALTPATPIDPGESWQPGDDPNTLVRVPPPDGNVDWSKLNQPFGEIRPDAPLVNDPEGESWQPGDVPVAPRQ